MTIQPLTTFEEEIRAKRAIKLAEKEHQDNLKRARRLGRLGKLQETLKDKSVVDRDSLKKVERLEKLTKKIRGAKRAAKMKTWIENNPLIYVTLSENRDN